MMSEEDAAGLEFVEMASSRRTGQCRWLGKTPFHLRRDLAEESCIGRPSAIIFSRL
jgi:hypothetical protein